MDTRTKLNIALWVVSVMSLLNVFSKPLHIPEVATGLLLLAVFIALGFAFHYIRKQKQEKLEQPAVQSVAAQSAADPQKAIRKRLILMMVVGSVVGLCTPLWMPLTGTTLGANGDLIIGLITTAVVCTIFGYKLSRT